MPGMLLHQGAMAQCAHGGMALPTMPFARVLVSGQPIVLQTTPYTVTGCSFVPPAGNGPCVSAQWLTGATRVLANGIPVVLSESEALCVPTSTGLLVTLVQQRVTGE